MNKKLKKILSLFLALAITVVSLSVNGLLELDFGKLFFVVAEATGEFEDDELDSGSDEYHPLDNEYAYKIISDEEAIIIEKRMYDSELYESQKIVIPSFVDGYSVIGIGDNVFYGDDSIAEVVIPDSVVSIGANAFAYCQNLVSVSMGSGVTDIGEGAFEYCSSLSDVQFGENVEVLSGSVFSNCTALETIEIPDKVLSISERCFENCINLSEVKFHDNLQVIGERAFSGCDSIEDVNIPDSVTEIGDYAFGGCDSLVYIDFGNSLTSIGEGAVANCDSIEEIVVPDSVEFLGASAFARNDKLSSVTIGKGVSTMGELVFVSCPLLNKIVVDENNPYFTAEDNILFSKNKTELIYYPYAKNETEYAIPDSVVTVSYGAFYGCDKLNKIVIPDTVKRIGDGAFGDCINLSEIDISENVSVIGRFAFVSTGYYNNFDNWEDGVLYLGNNLISGSSEVPEIYIVKDGTKTIADYAMASCDTLVSLTISDGVENIGYGAFWGCKSLENVKISSDIKRIDEYTFFGSKIYNDSKRWNDNGLYVDNVLVAVNADATGRFLIKTGTTFIADKVFVSCKKLEEIIVPETVTAMSENAFAGVGDAIVCCLPDSYAAEYCATNNINYVVSSYESLKLDTANVKTDYTVGDSLNTDGLSVYAVYNGGVEIPVPLSDVTFSMSEFKKAGQFRVIVSYNGKSSYYTVTVSDPVLQSVEIKTMPVKTDYIIGEAIDTEGLVLTVFYSNSIRKEITEGFTVSRNSDELGEAVITVSYSENGVTAQTQYTVTVSEVNNAVVSAENKSVLPGETVSVPITISNNSGFMGFAVNIAYNDTVFTPVSVTSGEILSNGMLNDSIGGNIEKGNLKVVFSSTENVMADGLLFTIEFKVDKLAASDVYNFDVSYIESDTFDENWNDVTLTCEDFKIEINNNANNLPVFYAESIEGKSGMNVTVPIMLGSGIGLTAFDLVLSYDESLLKPLSVSAGEVLNGEIESNCNDASGELVLKWNGEAVKSNGVAAYVIFEISEDALGKTELTISCADGFEAECGRFLMNISKPGTGSSAELYSTTVFVLPGKTVDIPVYISGNTGIMGFGLNVSYDSEKITPLSVEKGNLLSSGMLDNNIGVNEGSYKIIWNHSADIDGDGLLLTLSFKAAKNLSVQSIPVTIEYIKADTYNEAWETVELVTNDIIVMADSLIITPSDTEMFTGETLQLSAAYNYSQESCSIKWISDNTEIADVDENGKVVAHSFGTVTITATTDDGRYSASCEIDVIPRTLTVEWIVDGKTTIQTVKEGDKIIPPDTPEKEGYTFLEWTPEVPDIMAQENLSFSAVWIAHTYTVKYNANGGSGAPSEQTKVHGTVLTLSLDKPTRTGYTFIGWNTKADGTEMSYASGTSYTANVGVTLYAQWKANTYRITFDANGGTVSPSSKDVTYASTYGILPTAIRSGYIFNGWYTAKTGGTKVTSSSTVSITANQTFYAQWTEIVLSSIDVKSNPIVVNYYVGDTLDTTGLVLTANYNNNKTETISEGFVCTPTTLNTAGTQEITVTYGGKTTTFNVTVEEVVFTGVEINSNPSRTSYYVGDTLDTSGLTLTAKYNNGTTKTISRGFTCTPTTLNTEGTQEITVIYEGKTTCFNVFVNAVEILEITIEKEPENLNYFVGDTLDTNGLEILISYNNGTTETITSGFTCTPEILETEGTQKITVSYSGKTTTFNVSVATVKVTDLEIVTAPNKTSYKVGDKFAPTGLTMNAVNSKGETIVVSEGFVCTPEILDKAGTQVVTVSYGGKSVMITVIVDEVTPETYTVKFVSNGETVSKTAYEVGKTIVKPSMPTKDGYKFMGWTPSVPDIMPSYDLTFTAVFEKSYICPDCGVEILGEDAINAHIAAENAAKIKTTVKIKNNPSSKTINYGETLRLTAITTDMPADAKIYWYIDGVKKGEGTTFEVSPSSGSVEVTVKAVDANGKVLVNINGNEVSDSQKVSVNSGIWQKIVSFFKNLFGINRTVVQAIFKGTF
ncbi:MAG: leucine-rich repeat protein [Clostridia bacterium]|nr:leucine-rich repeat protein [Clostridia bacterium]